MKLLQKYKPDGKEIKLEKKWIIKKNEKGKIKINL